jgi:thiosulfate/3-mercaptopyruvate sulfurtransferase
MVAELRIMNAGTFLRTGGIAILGVVCCLAGAVCVQGQWAQPTGSAASIPASALIQPPELNRTLLEKNVARPLILQVGSRMMFDEAHIPGAEYAGPGSEETGLSLLRRRVARLGRSSPIVIYCGCCPWSRCPNIEPAYTTLRHMGFTHVRALYLADNFGTDWANKGYPVDRSH